ncbi:hypothetical protein Q0Z83_068490 [Actinoplanes sichuanensis]|uniref:Uncharacterized protein n=1 Tax=Actinoplanes sichuanensis TaxID=512349 RepID=A0ABW4AC22_9ACTN|nr:hypothetical protein [Actinoplanes sichuanensis]BEL08658.1 hypothetical protein Q0Z83_068490 [Actinoplanes sichuanensis]
MALSTSRKLTFPAVLAVSAGLGLTSIGALPTPALAATSVIAGVPKPPDRQKQLEKALITEKDVPAGYLKQDTGGFAEIIAEMLLAQDPETNPCEAAGSVSSLSATGPAVGAGDPVPTIPPGTTPATSAPSAPEPIKASPPPPPVVEPDTAVPPTASAVFVHDKTGAVALELLSAVGDDAAAATVDQVQEILDECPQIEVESFKITTKPLSWNPSLGDESITATLDLQARFFGIDISAHLAFAQVAYRDVALSVALIGADDPKDRELKKITRTAVRKLVTTSGIHTAG